MSEQFKDPVPDRAPTRQEEKDAESAAKRVDLAEVARHEREMAERGAQVRGEGEIEPNERKET